MFENPILEAATRTPPWLHAAVWLPVSGVALVVGLLRGPAIWQAALVLVLAPVVWSLLEYALHRFAFHFTPGGPRAARIAFLIHDCHHVEPSDPYRNVLPLTVSLPLGAGIYGLSHVALGPVLGNVAFGALMLCYTGYDQFHWYLHQRDPVSAIGRRLKRHHMLHHFSAANINYGVTSPLWDYVFGTRTARRTTDPSPEHTP